MKFKVIKGIKTLIKTESNESLVCFKCKRGNYDLVGENKFKTNLYIWYWCTQREKRYNDLNIDISYIFCERCKHLVCGHSEVETEHIDYCIESYEGFENTL